MTLLDKVEITEKEGKKVRCITLVVQFPKDGVEFGSAMEQLSSLIYDNTNAEVVTGTPELDGVQL